MTVTSILTSAEPTDKRRQLPEEVASYVRELIISGTVKPGEFLRMEPIAEAMGVSNTPVREGLVSLRTEGFVRLVPRRGFVVAPFTPQDVYDLFWAQGQLGGELAARAAQKITPERLDRLEELLAEYEAVFANSDERGIADLGHAFHREVNLAAESYRLALLLSSVVLQLPNTFYAAIDGQVSATREAHPLLLVALKNHDSDRARTLMQDHLSSGADRLVGTLARRGVWADSEPEAQTATV